MAQTREPRPQVGSGLFGGRRLGASTVDRKFGIVDKGQLAAAVSVDASCVLSGCLIIVKTTIPIGAADRIADIASYWVLSREQKLLPHFGETGTAVFLIQKIE